MSATESAASTASRPHYQVTFAVLMVAVSSYALLQSLVLPVLPTIQKGLHTSQTNVTWVLTAYLLSASVFTPILGRVGDMVGKKKILVWVLVTLTVGSLLAAVATSIGVMIVARVIQGAGGAVLPLSFGIIRDEFPREKVMGAIGQASALLAVGSGAGIVLAGPLVGALNYHWLFWIPAVVVGIAAIAAVKVVPESAVRTPGKINWSGAALLTVWLVALLLAASEGSEWGWGSARVLGLFALSIVGIVLWVMAESRSSQPLVDMKMMRVRAVATTNLVALLFGVGMYATFAFLPAFLQAPTGAGYGFAASITKSGFFLLPMTVVMFFLGLLSGPLSNRIGAKAVLVIGAGISVVPLAMLTFAHGSQWSIYLASGLLGAGFGLAFSAMSNLIVAAVPASQTGVATGMNANIRTIGGAIGSAVMASIVASGAAPSGLPVESGYTNGFGFLAASAVIATLAAFAVPAVRRASQAGGYATSDATSVSRTSVSNNASAEPADSEHVVYNAELALVAAGTLAEEV